MVNARKRQRVVIMQRNRLLILHINLVFVATIHPIKGYLNTIHEKAVITAARRIRQHFANATNILFTVKENSW